MSEPIVNSNGVQAWHKLIGLIGVPTLILLIVLRLFATDLHDAKNAAEGAQRDMASSSILMERHYGQTIRVIDLLERVCRRVSKTDFEREACDD